MNNEHKVSDLEYDQMFEYLNDPQSSTDSSLDDIDSKELIPDKPPIKINTSMTTMIKSPDHTLCSLLSPKSPVSPHTVSTSMDLETNNNLLILLDWDDTLFPTSFITQILSSRDSNDLALVPDDDIEYLDKLGNNTFLLLNELIARYGSSNIHIVTNSLNGWIKESLCYAACISKIYKNIQLLLIQNNITMISAQSQYAQKMKNSKPLKWKELCFDDIFNQILIEHKSLHRHILSIGDQWTDHHAVKQSIQSLDSSLFCPIHHVLKLKMSPNVNDMINEILYIQCCFNQIFNVISNHSQSVHPVIIDYEEEEIKHYNQSNNISFCTK